MMTREVFILFTESSNWLRKLGKAPDTYKDYADFMINETSFLNDDVSLAQRWWHIKTNILSVPKCKTCSNYVKFDTKRANYRDFCSIGCVGKHPETIDKRKQTSYKNWGVDNPSKSEQIVAKIAHVMKEKYDGAGFASEQIKTKIKETCSLLYGYDHPQTNKAIKDKIKQTNIERLGVEYPMQNEMVRDKSNSSVFSKYGYNHISRVPEIKEKKKQIILERYGVEHISQALEVKEKIKKINLKKYGVDSHLSAEVIKDKIKQTNIERLGVEYPMQNEMVRDKSIKTCLEKYHDTTPSRCVAIKEKAKSTNNKKYNRNSASQIHIDVEVLQKLEDKEWLLDQNHNKKLTLIEIAMALGTTPSTVSHYCLKHSINVKYFNQSLGEKELYNFILENIIAQHNDRKTITPHELDIYIPSKNIAIEYCGLYWHSEAQKTNDYHYMKYIKCKEKSIRLVTIFENEWKNNKELVKCKVLNILNLSKDKAVYARTTTVSTLDKKTKKMFLDKHHIQGDGPSSINYGLMHNNELVACIVFIKQEDHYILNRYATSCNVPGGFSKLLKHFENEFNNPKIVTFADLRWSEGDLYKNNGFVIDTILRPDYNWTNGLDIWHKFNFRHKMLRNKLKIYDRQLSESENMHNNNYYKIYDCGKIKFIRHNVLC